MSKYKKISSIIKLMRPQSVILMLLFVYVPIVKIVFEAKYAIMQLIPLYFLLTGEIVLNDYLDVEKDKINKNHRPLASEAVSMSLAKYLIFFFLAVAIGTGIAIYKDSPIRLCLFFVVYFLLTIYSFCINHLAIIKTFLTAFITVLCLCFIFTFKEINFKIVLYIISAYFFICSRELLMDIRDYEGDKKYNCETLAIRFGKTITYRLAAVFMLVSQLIYIYYLELVGNWKEKTLCVVGAVILIGCFIIFRTQNVQLQNKIAIILWLPMLFTIPSLF